MLRLLLFDDLLELPHLEVLLGVVYFPDLDGGRSEHGRVSPEVRALKVALLVYCYYHTFKVTARSKWGKRSLITYLRSLQAQIGQQDLCYIPKLLPIYYITTRSKWGKGPLIHTLGHCKLKLGNRTSTTYLRSL